MGICLNQINNTIKKVFRFCVMHRPPCSVRYSKDDLFVNTCNTSEGLRVIFGGIGSGRTPHLGILRTNLKINGHFHNKSTMLKMLHHIPSEIC